jgi:hypothetical protein
MRRLFVGCLIFIVGCLSTDVVFAQRSSTSGAIFLKQAMGTRAAGMGEAFCAVADDLSAVYYNPAGLVQLNVREPMMESVSSDLSQRLLKLKNRQLTAMYLKGLVDTGYSFFGYEQSLNIGGFFGKRIVGIAGSLVTFQGGDIQINTTNSDGSFQDSRTVCAEQDYLFTFTYSEYVSMIKLFLTEKSLGRNFIGVNLKVMHSELAREYQAIAFALDFGWLYKSMFENVSLGINLQNLGKGIKYEDEEDPLPLNVRTGIAWNFGPMENGVAACDLIVPLDDFGDKMKINLGTEYWFKEVIAARIGYKIGYDLDSFTCGAGFKIKGWQLDYAFCLKDEINPLYQLSLTLNF